MNFVRQKNDRVGVYLFGILGPRKLYCLSVDLLEKLTLSLLEMLIMGLSEGCRLVYSAGYQR
jgi:hypothetical protein